MIQNIHIHQILKVCTAQFRILVPSSIAPPSTGTPGIWRRRSGNGVVDAQGNLLIHPMVRIYRKINSCLVPTALQTWIDERLFGWSRSAKHGTSAWSGSHTPGVDISRSGSPNETDDEEAPDYDNVLGYFPDQDHQLGSPRGYKSRSRNSSYADLQRLRMTNGESIAHVHSFIASSLAWVASSPNLTADGLQLRHGHRSRKQSLSDLVSVDRLAVSPPLQPFEDTTTLINKEMEKKKIHDD